MRIAISIDGQFVPMTGVQHYVDSLLDALYESDSSHEIAAFAPLLLPTIQPLEAAVADGRFAWQRHGRCRIDSAGSAAELSRLASVAHRPRLRVWAANADARLIGPKRRTLELRARQASARYDVLHLPCPLAPVRFEEWRARRANVVTIYDMTIRLFAHAHEPANIAAWERFFRFAREQAARVLTISEASKRDIVALLDIPAERVVVTPLAPRASTREVPDGDERRTLLADVGLGEDVPFVLYAGSLERRKNLPQLVHGFARAIDAAPAILAEHKLVLAGGSWENHDVELRDLAGSLGIGGRLVLPGYLTNAQLNALLSACACFAYVSRYEGFGLPPLEAMACGAPVVASNVSSLPEVMGEAGISVSPDDADGIGAALWRLLTDPVENARRRDLSRTQARQFSWQRTAALTLKAYEEAAEAGAPAQQP
jgi:glycosyltransferase involved in cell wall biosynthesis